MFAVSALASCTRKAAASAADHQQCRRIDSIVVAVALAPVLLNTCAPPRCICKQCGPHGSLHAYLSLAVDADLRVFNCEWLPVLPSHLMKLLDAITSVHHALCMCSKHWSTGIYRAPVAVDVALRWCALDSQVWAQHVRAWVLACSRRPFVSPQKVLETVSILPLFSDAPASSPACAAYTTTPWLHSSALLELLRYVCGAGLWCAASAVSALYAALNK
jgi:hypothetical protein